MDLNKDVINISAVRVAGVGGLGLVVMALAVAWGIPRIGQTLALSAALGVILAAGLILYRRHAGPMRSSGQRPAARTALSVESRTKG